MTPIELIHKLKLNDIPDAVKEQAKLSILDLIGIGAGGAGTRLSAIIREHAAQEFGGTIPMLFDGRTASAQGAALAFCWQPFWAMNLAHARRWRNMQPHQIITHLAVGAL